MAAYYNEIDPFAAGWLRNLIDAGKIAPGIVDERSIVDVAPSDLAGFTQCHFFAGIGVWSHALRLGGWPDDRPVWTGSCPCQPYSAAGQGRGFADERHLWPAWHHLIRACRPAQVFGEQVASKAALPWVDLIHADMEGEGYSLWIEDRCSAGVGAPHIRQRLYFTFWLQHAARNGWAERWPEPSERGALGGRGDCGLADMSEPRRVSWRGASEAGDSGGPVEPGRQRDVSRLVNSNGGDAGPERQRSGGQYGLVAEDRGSRQLRPLGDSGASGLPLCEREALERTRGWGEGRAGASAAHGEQATCGIGGSGAVLGVEHAVDGRRVRRQPTASRHDDDRAGSGWPEGEYGVGGSGAPWGSPRPGPTNGFWRDSDWLQCRDGRWRPVEPGTFPLAHGVAGRVGRIRAYGNAIDAQNAADFIATWLDCEAAGFPDPLLHSGLAPDIQDLI